MDKTKKVISLKLAKQITKVAKEKRIGLPVSENIWIDAGSSKKEMVLYSGLNRDWEEYYSAYDTSELGDMLPKIIDNKEIIIRFFSKWNIGYAIGTSTGLVKDLIINPFFEARTEVEARGKMLLYLLENNLLK